MKTIKDRPASISERARRGYLSLHLLLWSCVLGLFAFQYFYEFGDTRLLATQALFLVAGGVGLLSRYLPSGVWSPAGLFLLLVAVFHLGLAPYWILGLDPGLPLDSDYIWFKGPIAAISLRLINVGLAAYVLGVLLRASAAKSRDSEIGRSMQSLPTSSAYAGLGGVIVTVSVASWFWIVTSSGGFGLLVASYGSYLELTAGTALPYVFLLIGFGMGLAAMELAAPMARVGMVAFIVFAMFGFFLGLRGEVLFPAAVAASVIGMRRNMPNMLRTLGILAAVLVLVDIARQVRQGGISAGLSDIAANPLSSLTELGSTLRVVAVVVEWHRGLGEAWAGGATYSVFFVRTFESFWDIGIPAEEDFRIFNVEIAERAGNIGGSVVAESFHNFGAMGVVLVFVIIGWLLSSFSLRIMSPTRIAVYACIGAPLFNHIRNSFVPVVPALLLGLLIVGLFTLIGRRAALSDANRIVSLGPDLRSSRGRFASSRSRSRGALT